MGAIGVVSDSKLHVLCVGPSECGKTHLLHSLYVPKFPRVISIDINGEVEKWNPGAIEATSIEDIVAIGLAGAKLGKHRWHINAVLPRREYGALFRLLAPEFRGKDSPPSFTRAVGGIALECSEAYAFVPNQGADDDVIEAFARGRHHYLSFLLASQRPASLAVITRTQADVIVTWAQDDPNEIKWLRSSCSVYIGAFPN